MRRHPIGFVRLCGLAALALLLAGAPARAAAPVAATLTAQDQADLHRIETYLDGITTLEAKFEQTNQDGSTSSGRVFLSRPGKMRFAYDPPAQLEIVSDGTYVAVDDTGLKQVQFYPVESTPVWFLLREGIKLSGDVTVTRFERGPQTLRITCVQTRSPSNGSITLVFSAQPLALRQWEVVDQQGRTTDVALIDVETGVKLDPDQFELPAAPSRSAGQRDER